VDSDQISVSIRVNGELRPVASDLPGGALFPIYSITKTLTAICILRLAELGLLRLDDAARQWLPETAVPAAITVAHLLRHTSGLRDYGPLSDYHQAVRAHPGEPWTRQRFLDAVLPDGLLFAPGEGWAYSNVGYMLLADITERASGRAFARVLNELVAAPLGLQRTVVVERVHDLMACIAGFGPEVTADRRIVDVRGRYHPGWCAPRLAASTTEEISELFDALIAGRVLAPNTLEQMLTFVPFATPGEPGRVIGSGMGLYCDGGSPFGRSSHHGGGGPGYNLTATVYPDTTPGRVSIAVFVNSSVGRRAIDCEQALLATLLQEAR